MFLRITQERKEKRILRGKIIFCRTATSFSHLQYFLPKHVTWHRQNGPVCEKRMSIQSLFFDVCCYRLYMSLARELRLRISWQAAKVLMSVIIYRRQSAVFPITFPYLCKIRIYLWTFVFLCSWWRKRICTGW